MATNQQTIIKERAYTLTPEEKNVLGNQLLGLLNDEDELARDKKAAIADFKSQEEVLANRIIRLREKASTGIELRKYKCYTIRNAQSHTVDTVYAEDYGKDMMTGDLYEQRPWEPEDWNAHAIESQIPLDFNSAENPDAPDENTLRAKANLTTQGEIEPDRDENKDVVAGPNTDAYNAANPGDTSYQHLSGDAEFKPVIPMYQQQGAANEQANDGSEPTDAADVDPSDAQDTPQDDSEDNEDDEPSDDNEPQKPTPKVPKRKANRTPPKK